jgi:4-diphosphocytidyl-2C-methyl-D-erythritol kinase
VVTERFPRLKQLLKELEPWGPARMTGTGSTFFLSMPDEMTANRTAQAMKCRYNVRAVRGVDLSPLHGAFDSGGAAD